MKSHKAKVKVAYPVGDHGLLPVPKELDVMRVLSSQDVYLYNPFDTGLSLKKVPLSSLTYEKLVSGFIRESGEMLVGSGKGPEQQQKHKLLNSVGETFWPVAKNIFARLVIVPKRNNGLNNKINPSMGLIMSPPKRKIKAPSLTPKPGPPSPGGR